MTYTCPICKQIFNTSELQQPAGIGGGTYCPKCQGQAYVSFPYWWIVAVASFLLAVGTLYLIHVRSILWFIVGTIVLWVPYSLFLNIYSTRFKNSTLKKWKPRRRSFFEWLYERDVPKNLIGRQR